MRRNWRPPTREGCARNSPPPPPLRGEGRDREFRLSAALTGPALLPSPLRGESGPTTRRFSLRKTSIWGPPHGPVRGAALPPLGGVGSLPLWGESVLAYAASLTGCLDDP